MMVPYCALNYSLPFTEVNFWWYTLANNSLILISLPYTYFGITAESLDDLTSTDIKWETYITLALGGICIIVFVIFIIFCARKEVK